MDAVYSVHAQWLFAPQLTRRQNGSHCGASQHSRSAKVQNQRWITSTTKQAISIKLSTTVGLFFMWPWLWKRVYGLTIMYVVVAEYMPNTIEIINTM